MVSKLQMSSAKGKYHGIGQKHSRDVEVPAAAFVVHISSQYTLEGVIAVHIVGLDDGVEILELILASPHLIIAEIHITRSGDPVRSIARYRIEYQPLVRMCLLHSIDE